MVLLDHSSPCGVYDQAVEASAEKLMLAARESNSSSGYASDADTLESQESTGDLVSISSSSSSNSVSDDSEDETIESEIAFLQQKQYLLKKAMAAMKREEMYDAFKARDIVHGRTPAEAPIWKEAREVLEVLKVSDAGNNGRSRKAAAFPSASASRRCPKRPRIDVSTVLCKTSMEEDDAPAIRNSFDRLIPNKQILWAGHWVAQAMADALDFSRCSSPSVESTSSSTWEVMNDPDLGPLVVPPSKLQFKSEVQLKDALSFTPSAQLITISTPPFFVVHANKAFSIFSGLQNADVVGKPVDVVLQVVKNKRPRFASSPLQAAKPSQGVRGKVVGSGKECQVELTPISDHYRNPQRWISHLLMRLEDSSNEDQDDTRSFDLVELVHKSGAVATTRHNPRGHHGFGTVG